MSTINYVLGMKETNVMNLNIEQLFNNAYLFNNKLFYQIKLSKQENIVDLHLYGDS